MEIWVLSQHWVQPYENGHAVLGAYDSKEKGIEALKKTYERDLQWFEDNHQYNLIVDNLNLDNLYSEVESVEYNSYAKLTQVTVL